jgi:hypothetical protein
MPKRAWADAKGLKSHPQGPGITAGDDGGCDAGHCEQFQAMPIQRAEALQRFTLLGEVQAAVSEDAVHIEESHANALCREQQLGRKVQ